MRVLIDTHALLWLFTDDPRLSRRAKEIFLDTKNKLHVSIVSLWEIAIKASLKKIVLKDRWFPLLQTHLHENGISWLPLTPEHCHQVSLLPFHHRDPFDRMLISQAITEEMKFLTCDHQIKDYGIDCLW